jgi:uncharacterized radical SAM superfamily Fe-S cluster-containing enzyme
MKSTIKEVKEVIIGRTQSLCPICLKRIPAEKIKYGRDIYLRKTCLEHGDFQTIIWRGTPDYFSWIRDKAPDPAEASQTEKDRGCPYDCGLCPDHRQRVCCAQIEVTQRCNLGCPVCFADAGNGRRQDPGGDEVVRQLQILHDTVGICNIQISGGEPTIRDDLPDIIQSGHNLGFKFFQLNTNGIRLAEDPGYVKALKEAGLSTVYLQFDGTSDDVYQKIRGKDLMTVKKNAIENCRENRLGVVLVPTLVTGVNTDQIGDIVRFALDRLPVVRGVHFQPMSYFGRYPGQPDNTERFTLPEVMTALEQQMGGVIKTTDFVPSGCEDALCSFHGDFLRKESGELSPVTDTKSACCGMASGNPGESVRRSQNYVSERWQLPDDSECCNAERNDASADELDRFLYSLRNNRLSITCMVFQDAENVDIERLKYCCIQVVHDGRVIPFCAYNISDREGRTLYRK